MADKTLQIRPAPTGRGHDYRKPTAFYRGKSGDFLLLSPTSLAALRLAGNGVLRLFITLKNVK